MNTGEKSSSLFEDPRFQIALRLFNSGEWYPAHDAFEELWHETIGPERTTLQGVLQVAVAQVHLERGNKSGATILYGEGLGRLKSLDVPDFGLDLVRFCSCVEERLKLLQQDMDPDLCSVPFLFQRDNCS